MKNMPIYLATPIGRITIYAHQYASRVFHSNKHSKSNKPHFREVEITKIMMPDNPIPNKEKDSLHRYPLAKRIAEMINNFKDNDSLVIGVEGEWGSGKTSFINLILEDLRATNALLITFNPWNFSDQNELIKDFFDSTIDALQEADRQGGAKAKKIAKKIKGYGSKLLKQSRIFRENQHVGTLIMDSNELERERGITILAKNTAVTYKGPTLTRDALNGEAILRDDEPAVRTLVSLRLHPGPHGAKPRASTAAK